MSLEAVYYEEIINATLYGRSEGLEGKWANLVVDECAIMFPPMALTWGPIKAADPSTTAVTWLVITTATPNCDNQKERVRVSIPDNYLGSIFVVARELTDRQSHNSAILSVGHLRFIFVVYIFACTFIQYTSTMSIQNPQHRELYLICHFRDSPEEFPEVHLPVS